ncbi:MULTISPECIES: TRAP transporter large permease [Anaerococcus]|uniref:TRAP transporter large permease n=1 Tax=Anaerococcus TaxID=165779 RepID=UPI001AE65FBF|nr:MULTISPECIES: TRAP transporter large permease [Anaerococcus]MBP2068900.1 tripartite ATP-independent transporter DctM subunit [Anaerococcus nagyae]MDU2566036.1 TRAP transporter large permease [Anaerococcus sp.]
MSIGMTALALFLIFFIFLFIGVPISVSILLSSIATAILSGLTWNHIQFIAMQKMNSGIESFSLLAVPLFILAGNIMNNGGIARRLIKFSELFVGNIRGSLAHANALGNIFFGALSGSAVAAASAMGGTIYPVQKEQSYDKEIATAVNIASAPAGLLIPPTSAPIVYSTVAGGVSISAMFMGGYIPGTIMGLIAIYFGYRYAREHNYPVSGRPKKPGKVILDALPSLLMILIVIGGIVGGIFTATEGAGISVLYSLILSILYKSINLKTLRQILLKTAETSGVVLFLISASTVMSWVMAYTGIPQAISDGILGLTNNKYVILLLMNIILLLVGMFMDITPAILIFTPIFLPIAESLGMNAIQFGIVLIYNMCIGTMTPPVGSVLFVASGITKVKIENLAKVLLPFLLANLVVLLLITFIPQIIMFLPEIMGLI